MESKGPNESDQTNLNKEVSKYLLEFEKYGLWGCYDERRELRQKLKETIFKFHPELNRSNEVYISWSKFIAGSDEYIDLKQRDLQYCKSKTKAIFRSLKTNRTIIDMHSKVMPSVKELFIRDKLLEERIEVKTHSFNNCVNLKFQFHKYIDIIIRERIRPTEEIKDCFKRLHDLPETEDSKEKERLKKKLQNMFLKTAPLKYGLNSTIEDFRKWSAYILSHYSAFALLMKNTIDRDEQKYEDIIKNLFLKSVDRALLEKYPKLRHSKNCIEFQYKIEKLERKKCVPTELSTTEMGLNLGAKIDEHSKFSYSEERYIIMIKKVFKNLCLLLKEKQQNNGEEIEVLKQALHDMFHDNLPVTYGLKTSIEDFKLWSAYIISHYEAFVSLLKNNVDEDDQEYESIMKDLFLSSVHRTLVEEYPELEQARDCIDFLLEIEIIERAKCNRIKLSLTEMGLNSGSKANDKSSVSRSQDCRLRRIGNLFRKLCLLLEEGSTGEIEELKQELNDMFHANLPIRYGHQTSLGDFKRWSAYMILFCSIFVGSIRRWEAKEFDRYDEIIKDLVLSSIEQEFLFTHPEVELSWNVGGIYSVIMELVR